MKLFLTLVITLLLVVLGLSFGAQNDTQVMINYLIARGTFSLPAVLAVVLVTGFLLGWLLSLFAYTRLRLRYLNLLRKHKKLERKLTKAP